MLSIVTPTYNRAHTLPRLYESLLANAKEGKDFEWIVVDDGSTDGTKELIATYEKVSPFPVLYCYQENAGKMAALNTGVPKAKGELLLELDSDDFLLPHAVKTILEDYEAKKKTPDVYGFLYLRRASDHPPMPFPVKDRAIQMFSLYMEEDYRGETTIVFLTKERKKYHHRLEHKEKFVTEARLYHEMDQDYNGLLPLDDEVVGGVYEEDGYSQNIMDLFLKYPYGYFAYFKEALAFPSDKIKWKKRLYLVKHYILFGTLTNKKKQELLEPLTGMSRYLVKYLYRIGTWMSKKKQKEAGVK